LALMLAREPGHLVEHASHLRMSENHIDNLLS
jgi:hypothetical protein